MRQRLRQLDLTPPKRRRLLWRVAKYGVVAAAKRHVRQQQSPDGRPWTPRQSRRRGKMLRNMPKLLHIREMPEIDAVRIYLHGGGYRNGNRPVPAGVVGYGQQNGMRVTVNRRQAMQQQDDPGQDAAATLRQTKRLRKLGYKTRNGTRWRKPGYAEIQATLTKQKAGVIIRSMEGRPPKTSWSVDVPNREFLGISQDDLNTAMEKQIQAIGYGT
nr:phage virion morphogenesis protein [Pectobacterium sp. IFB5596]